MSLGIRDFPKECDLPELSRLLIATYHSERLPVDVADIRFSGKQLDTVASTVNRRAQKLLLIKMQLGTVGCTVSRQCLSAAWKRLRQEPEERSEYMSAAWDQLWQESILWFAQSGQVQDDAISRFLPPPPPPPHGELDTNDDIATYGYGSGSFHHSQSPSPLSAEVELSLPISSTSFSSIASTSLSTGLSPSWSSSDSGSSYDNRSNIALAPSEYPPSHHMDELCEVVAPQHQSAGDASHQQHLFIPPSPLPFQLSQYTSPSAPYHQHSTYQLSPPQVHPPALQQPLDQPTWASTSTWLHQSAPSSPSAYQPESDSLSRISWYEPDSSPWSPYPVSPVANPLEDAVAAMQRLHLSDHPSCSSLELTSPDGYASPRPPTLCAREHSTLARGSLPCLQVLVCWSYQLSCTEPRVRVHPMVLERALVYYNTETSNLPNICDCLWLFLTNICETMHHYYYTSSAPTESWESYVLHCISDLVTFSNPRVQAHQELVTFFNRARMQWGETITGNDLSLVLYKYYPKAVQVAKHSSIAAGNMAMALITICYQQGIDSKIGQLFAPDGQLEGWQLLVSTLDRWLRDVTYKSIDSEAPPNQFFHHVHATLNLLCVSELRDSQATLKVMNNRVEEENPSMWFSTPQSPPDLPEFERKEKEPTDMDEGPHDNDEDFHD